jgi:hypothetical protein
LWSLIGTDGGWPATENGNTHGGQRPARQSPEDAYQELDKQQGVEQVFIDPAAIFLVYHLVSPRYPNHRRVIGNRRGKNPSFGGGGRAKHAHLPQSWYLSRQIL